MLPRNPSNPQQNMESLYYAAVRIHEVGDFDGAKQQYELILKQAPNQLETNYQYGRLLVQMGALRRRRSTSRRPRRCRLRPMSSDVF